jgi:hypothetical protein
LAIPLTAPQFRTPVAADDPEPVKPAVRGVLQRLALAQSRWQTWAVITSVGLGSLTFAFLRYQVLVSGGAPATVDAGNWLAFGKDLLGPALRPGSVYPPLVPLIVTGGIRAFGLVSGVALVAAAASIAPALALFVVLYRHKLGWWSVGLAALVLAAGATGEATAWGGFPQLFATALTILFLWRWDQTLRRRTIGAGLTSGVLLGLVAASSHLMVMFAVLAALLILLGHLWFRVPHTGSWRRLVAVLAMTILPSLALLPLYLRLSGTVLTNVAGRISTPSLGLWLGHLEFMYRENPILWRTLLVAGGLAILLLVSRRRETLWLLPTSMSLGAFALARLADEPRFLDLLEPAAILAIGLWVSDVRSFGRQAFRVTRGAAAVALVLAVVVQATQGLSAFPQQRDFYGVMRPGTVSSIQWISDRTPKEAVVAVSRLGEAPLGWWVEGLGRRPTLYASSLIWVNFPDERRRVRLANDIFTPTFPSTQGLTRACGAGVSYVLVAKGWAGFDPEQTAAIGAAHHGAVVVNNSDAVVLSMAALGCPQRGTRG